MMLDHFVIHIDDDPTILNQLKLHLEERGVPFEPDWGKGTKGFKAANVWIGRQYFEIIRILSPDGGGWVPNWVARHSKGVRGLYCVFLRTDKLDELDTRLRAAGMETSGPERITFRAFFGLIKKSMPWRVLYLPPIPGTELELAFIEYDPDPKDILKTHMVPNADERGITGIAEACLHLPLTKDARAFLAQVFLDRDETDEVVTVQLEHGHLRFETARDVRAVLVAQRVETTESPVQVVLENVSLFV